jgi:hypothetical protein
VYYRISSDLRGPYGPLLLGKRIEGVLSVEPA